jgi:hypothetical protein
MSSDLYSILTLRSGPPTTAPAIVTSSSAPMLVLLPIEGREAAIRDLAVAYRAAGPRALTDAGAVMLAVMGAGARGLGDDQLVERWAAALGCEVVVLAERR